ncbi:MAG TPA: 30S ribosomal protein S16 [candidate division WWE3 bacterium]|uniref:Small ribosomal subunit protein bS16 n=1 Tax=candidate division WWE3 bacterium TaxID=2053526 RepID=A0A7V5MIP8_UNCKA|nr:30S ribosomal protein S16 [candidate division WWE3 bacterium]
MLKIRLLKRGRKNAPSYRIVVAESRRARDGKHLEVIGFYNPSYNPVLFKYDKERYTYWISKGAQPTEAVVKLIDGKYEFKKYAPKAEGENNSEEGEQTAPAEGKEKTEAEEATEPAKEGEASKEEKSENQTEKQAGDTSNPKAEETNKEEKPKE